MLGQNGLMVVVPHSTNQEGQISVGLTNQRPGIVLTGQAAAEVNDVHDLHLEFLVV